ncbi:TPA: hypothetical protein DDZ10_04535 [Candidatus Uhrbacteria bacterium]|uniref:Uncharacterized protein n=1 Tax=Candidatus Uhrbacteria bacterium GW2011_GWC2_53_7 TaxID=1618986 RepID=A0A0G2AVX1_9BACT|nr:MAG: hypothetical protein UY79_C0005G0030 [Parcubacteria group bacterium GW2011_GWA2_53_21]KKW37059.1 MAG: hypothetical protein UY82_C0003G0013 [Candidatus Uhrbacteria bacterium GW2011_GWC2_53_7]OGL72017.1 MAG: hypothetical protein A3D69_00750 [Candidatus Uhrbacteria bacterium RIFCSPHIGHO2_02_FULL_54_11]HBL39902.1 hypothetical protein [Candidatus Uhrbacteria bacterium]
MLLRSAFLITLTTYLLLILAESLKPGFVSNYFSAHWLLLVSLVLFAGTVHRGKSLEISPWLGWVLTTVVAIVAGVVTWNLGEPLGSLRPILTLLALALPFTIHRILDPS